MVFWDWPLPTFCTHVTKYTVFFYLRTSLRNTILKEQRTILFDDQPDNLGHSFSTTYFSVHQAFQLPPILKFQYWACLGTGSLEWNIIQALLNIHQFYLYLSVNPKHSICCLKVSPPASESNLLPPHNLIWEILWSRQNLLLLLCLCLVGLIWNTYQCCQSNLCTCPKLW